MSNIRKAQAKDLGRIAEIEVFNYRLNFFPIFKSEWFYFVELTVENVAGRYKHLLDYIWVYEDVAVKGFVMVEQGQIRKLFVEPVLQSGGIGKNLLDFAVNQLGGRYLWALEKNTRALEFYRRNGFALTGDKKLEEDTTEYLVKMEI